MVVDEAGPGAVWADPSSLRGVTLGACPTLTFLLWRTIRDHLRRARPEKILNVFQRIHLRFFRACGLASGRTSFASSRTAMSDRLLVQRPEASLFAAGVYLTVLVYALFPGDL